MKIGLLKNFLHYFNLRQGTILIAIFQLVTKISMKCLASPEQLFFTEYDCKNITVFFRIQYDIFHPGASTCNGDSRNGGERH